MVKTEAHSNRLQRMESVDASQFKEAMRCIVSTVSVITTGEAGAFNGMTATAICSVSTTPPSILIVVNQENRSHALIEKTGAFAINVLSSHQKLLALHFSSKPVDPFGSIAHHIGITKVPLIDGGAAYLECIVESRMTSGTHSIFVGRIVASGHSDCYPLTYRQGEFLE